VPVSDDQQPGSLTALLARLERFWRESEAARQRANAVVTQPRERPAW
jgi:hypothetical protein